MRFAVATLALAGAAIAHGSAEEEAQSTVFSTEYYTVTSCPPEVTNCPASSTVVSSSVIPLTTSTVYATTTRTITDCPDTVTNCPADSTVLVTETVAVSTTVCPVGPEEPTVTPTWTWTPPSNGTGSAIPNPPYPTSTLVTVAPECPTVSVRTIKTSITTVIPTIIYETVEVPCPTAAPTSSAPSGYTPTTAKATPTGPVKGAAATLGGSFVLAAAAGLIALMA